MPRGGKRPGAGAPIGNTNALRHGRRSPRVHAVVRAIWGIPEVRRLFLAIIRKQSKMEAPIEANAPFYFPNNQTQSKGD